MSKKCYQILVMKQLFNKGDTIFTFIILIHFKIILKQTTNSESQIDKL